MEEDSWDVSELWWFCLSNRVIDSMYEIWWIERRMKCEDGK